MWECFGSGSSWGFGGGLIVPLLMIFVWALIIWGIVSLVRGFLHSDRPSSGTSNQNGAMEILRRRYAAGEIDRNEYEIRKRDLV